MLNAEKLKKIQEFIELSKSSLTEAEFVDAFKKVVDYVKAIQAANKDEMKALDNKYTNIVKGIESNYGGDMAGMKSEAMAMCEKEMGKMKGQVDAKMAEVKDGVDGLSADVDIVAKTASDLAITALKPLIPTIEVIEADLPKLGAPIRDALELLTGDDRLDKSAIKGLDEEFKRLEEVRGRVLGGGGGFNRMAMEQYFVDADTPVEVPNGVITDFTPTWAFIASSLKVYNDGQRMQLTTDYTIVGGKVVYNTAPLTDVIIIFEYRRA